MSTSSQPNEVTPNARATPRKIMRLPEVIQRCGIQRSTIYLWMSRGDFPQAKRIGAKAVGWDSQEIDRWIADRLEGRGWKPEGDS